MVGEWSFRIILIFFSCSLFSQEQQGLSFHIQSLVLFHFEDIDPLAIPSPYQKTAFELTDDSIIYGFNSEVNYYFNPNFALGVGLGIEKLTQPKIIYYPLYLNTIVALSKGKNNIYSKLNFGTHLGDGDTFGVMFRLGVGVQTKLSSKIKSNIGITYSRQDLHKTLENSPRQGNNHPIKAIGLTIGIEIY